MGAALTNRRFLAISDTSSGWREVHLNREDGAPVEVELGARIAFVIANRRILGFDGPSGLMNEVRLRPREYIISSGVNERVGVIVTNVRAIGLAAGRAKPVEKSLHVQENFESLRVLATTASVRTTRRILVFQSSSGSWRGEEI